MTEHVYSLTADELKHLVRAAVREELEAAGLRIAEPEQRDEAREDFRFVRKLRKNVEGTANKVGMAIILAMVSGVVAATWTGVRYLVRTP